MWKFAKFGSLVLLIWSNLALSEILPFTPSLLAPAVGATEPTSTTTDTSKNIRHLDCHWNECSWLPYPIETVRADRKGLSGGCLTRAKAISEMDLTRFATSLPDTHDWVLTQPASLIDEVLHLREQNACPSWATGQENLAKWDTAIANSCATVGRNLTADTLTPCLTAVMLFRSAMITALSGDEPIETIVDSQTTAHLFQSELYSGAPHLERLSALLDRFLTILPGDVPALTRLTSVYFASWANKPNAASKAGVSRTVARLELYSQNLNDLFPAEIMKALVEGNALNLRRWALKISEKQTGVDVAPYFLAWSSWLEHDGKQAQSYLRQILHNDDDTWDLEAHVALKRMLARTPETAKRTPFFPPGVQLKITFAVPNIGFAKDAKPFAPGDLLRLIGPEAIALFTNEVHAASNLPEVQEAVTEIRAGNRMPRTELEDFLHSSALTAMRAGQPTIAAAALRDLLAINSEHEGGLNLSQAMLLMERLKMNPQDLDAAMHLGQIWSQEKQYDAAAEQMRKLLALRPHNARAQESLRHFQSLQDWETRLQAEVKANSQSEISWYRYACFLVREERWEEAQRALDRVAAIDSNHPRAEAMRRKIQWWIQLADRNQRTADVYAFLNTELSDPQLAFPRSLATEILKH